MTQEEKSNLMRSITESILDEGEILKHLHYEVDCELITTEQFINELKEIAQRIDEVKSKIETAIQ